MVKDTADMAGPRLPWAGKRVSTEHVGDELSHLWRMSADNMRTSQNINVRTSVLNLVICVPDTESAQRASTLIRDLSSTNVARVILLILDTSSPDMVATWITTRSFPIISDIMRHHFEQITLIAGGSAVQSISNIVQPLLKPDLPVYLWWLNDPPSDHNLFDALSALSHRIIVDSSTFLAPEESICTLSSLLQAYPDSALSDLNWGRITPWRELVAQFFDVAEYKPYLAGIDHIEIEHAVFPFALPIRTEQGDVSPNPICALLLAGWLKASLGWKLSPGTHDMNEQHDSTSGSHHWRLLHSTGSLSGPSVRTNGSRTSKAEKPAYANLSIRPRIQSDMRPGSLCMVRMVGIVDNRRAIFTINREDGPDHVLTSVELEQETRPQRTVSMTASHKVSELLHDELEIVSRDHLYEQTLQEVLELLS